MASKSFDPTEAGYVPVNERIIEFYAKYPEGSLQSEIVEFGENIVIVKGYAYRTPDDPRPGTGHSQMPIPGLTNFTKNSEVENAETSAWGRALAAVGIEVKKSIASAEEVANKQAPPTTAPADAAPSFTGTSRPATPAQKRALMTRGRKYVGDDEAIRDFMEEHTGKNKSADLTNADIQTLFTALDEIEEKAINDILDQMAAESAEQTAKEE